FVDVAYETARATPTSTRFPYTTLFRSRPLCCAVVQRLDPQRRRGRHRLRGRQRLPAVLRREALHERRAVLERRVHERQLCRAVLDRKSTRLNSSHDQISYAVFCLKKKT